MSDTPLTQVIATAMHGDDKYKRWPLAEMCAADEEIRRLRQLVRDDRYEDSHIEEPDQ